MQRYKFQEFFNIYQYLCERCDSGEATEYWVPGGLFDGNTFTRLVNVGNPYRFFARIFEQIAECGETVNPSNGISTNDLIYQAYIRTFASLNNEIGTALKQIAFLPFLKEKLGVTVFINLPSGVIGETNRKGRRGSPFAIRNPFCIDPSMGDGLLPDFSATSQYKAMIQACQMLGIRAGSVAPLTILAMDSPFFKASPDLGYWWLAEPGELLFARYLEQGQHCSRSYPSKKEIHIDDFHKPRFVEPPRAEDVKVMEANGHVYYVASMEHCGQQRLITLANAFPDPVVGDTNSYTWKDVATVRYTRDLYPPPQGSRIKPEPDKTKPAWLIMPFLIAWRAENLGEDCFIIDVNENVPQEILRRASRVADCWNEDYQLLVDKLLDDPISLDELRRIYDELDCSRDEDGQVKQHRRIDFIAEELWNFEIDNSQISAITGPLINCVSAHSHNQDLLVQSLRHHLKLLESSASPRLYFGGVANHDTIPPSPRIAPLLYAIYHFLPRSVPMIFSGNEYYAPMIINKEFGFSSPELEALRENLRDEDLALFNDIPINWASLSTNDESGVIPIIPLLQALRRMRHQLFTLVSDELLGYQFLEPPQAPQCFGYLRERVDTRGDSIIVYANWNRQKSACIPWPVPDMKVIGTVTTGPHTTCLTADSTLILQPLSIVIMASGLFGSLPPFEF